MSRLQAAGDDAGMLALNSRANVLVATLVLPLFAFAEDIVTVVYTATYLDAAPVIRIYVVGLTALIVETAVLTMLLRQGGFMLWLNLLALLLSLAISWYLAQHIGIVGAAAGSVIAIFFDRIVTLRRVARCTGIPIGRLQDWRSLGLLLLLAALSAALAWGIAARGFVMSAPLARVALGGALMAAAYGALLASVGGGRVWLKAALGIARGRQREH